MANKATKLPNWRMKGLFAHGTRVRYPRFFHEYALGDIRSRLGQDRRHHHDPEIVLRFQRRKNFGKWETFAEFRYADIPQVEQHLAKADEAMRKLINHS